ncbi:ras and Rab interactor 3 isoform X1 [Gouania willdenowi]|uniref:Ras and Rab interactor 3-like n=2 Tax=Gouania willdenowi TaxID=441366 RepID=A0A8C5E0D4_GOUWI|nr:ras and Rab interactor 3-like isoform X1 [Gouania willdenowi]XP_028320268.1 ras and Rab interactor 3-like isoform X1 [Gouania willdenowi]
MAVHSPVNGTKSIPWRGRSRRRLSLVEQIRSCQEAWCPGAPWDRDRAHAAVHGTAAGSFLIVCDSSTSRPGLLCVCTGEQDGEVLDFMIRCTDTVFQLSQSHLCFSDLAQLVLFYSLTRDVLPVCLSVPPWVHSVNEMNGDHLEPSMWLISEQEAEGGTHREPVNVMCSTLLTSTNGALCVINPLYLREHEDEWLIPRAASQQSPMQMSVLRRERRLSTTRSWAGSALRKNRSVSMDGEPTASSSENSGVISSTSDDPSLLTDDGVVLRRLSKESAMSIGHSTESLSLSFPPTSGSSTPELQRHNSPVPQSPHRVSWIEDGIWLPPPRLSSPLHLPSLELDSLSVSSIEEEQEPQMQNHGCNHPSAHRLAGKVMHRLSAVGQALGGLVSQKKKLTNRVVELSERKDGAFAESVKDFLDLVLKKGANPNGVMGSEFLQEVRSMLTSLRETLFDYPEILAILEGFTDLNESEIDSLVEVSLHKVTLKPVSTHIYTCIHTSRTSDGTLDYLQSNQCALQLNAVDELGGSADVGIPDSVTLERIQQKWTSMHETYSPNKKVQIMLKVCKSIYHSMTANTSSVKVFGADDFLPCLTWVLLRSDLITLQIDTDYMMELLDPTQLQGEGGYYLTTLYAALFYISSFRPRLATRQLSVEAQQSLNQWHRRRTLHYNQSRQNKNRRTIRGQGRSSVNSSTKTAEGGSDECQQQKEDDSSTDALHTLREEPQRVRTQTPDHQPETTLNAMDRAKGDTHSFHTTGTEEREEDL